MMKKVKIMTVIALSTVLFVNCGVSRPIPEVAANSVKERTEFDMECSEVKTQQLGDIVTHDVGGGNYIAELNIGASGCGEKATYFVRCKYNHLDGAFCTPQLNSLTKPQSEDPVVE